MLLNGSKKVPGIWTHLADNPRPNIPRLGTKRNLTENILLAIACQTIAFKSNAPPRHQYGLLLAGQWRQHRNKNALEVWRRGGVQFPTQATIKQGRGRIITKAALRACSGSLRASQCVGQLIGWDATIEKSDAAKVAKGTQRATQSNADPSDAELGAGSVSVPMLAKAGKHNVTITCSPLLCW